MRRPGSEVARRFAGARSMGGCVPQHLCKTAKPTPAARMHPIPTGSLGGLGATWSLRLACSMHMVLLMMSTTMPSSCLQLSDGEATWGFCGDA